ncbi:MAG: hypothetical protein ACREHD_23620 [Pirellulales bacterium]
MANENRIKSDDFSNAASKQLYWDEWPDEPECKEKHHHGDQCGACSFFAPLNDDY